MNRTSIALALVAAVASCMLAAQASATPFVLAKTLELKVDYKGRPLIAGDTLDLTNGFDQADDLVVSATAQGEVVNVYRVSSDIIDYRKEAGLIGDKLELTVRFRLYAYPKTSLEQISYSFYIPADRLDGCSFRASTDRPYQEKIVEGVLKKDDPDGPIATRMNRMALTGPCGDLVLDFAPKGRALMFRNYCEALASNAWVLEKVGESFVFSLPMPVRWHGAIITSKVLLYEGKWDYVTTHPEYDDWHYACVPQTTIALAFYKPAPQGFKEMGTDEYADKRKAGWLSTEGLSMAPAVLGSMIAGKQAILKINTLPGYYLATVRFGGEEPLGPFAIAANDVLVASDLHADGGRVVSFTWPVRLRDGKLELSFASDTEFGVSAVILQRFLAENEDYAFDRGIWRIDGIPMPDKQIDPGKLSPGPSVGLTPSADWRWNAAMISFGSSNSGSRNELNTYPLIERRIQEVVDMGFNTIICDGLHFRLNFLDKQDMIERNMKMICEVAHRYGVRVIEHHDVPLMLAQGTGYNVMVEHADWLQRDIETGKVAAAFCPVNPDFRNWYYNRFRQYARNTNLDGSMLDEVDFFGPRFCGCRHCREAFTRETGHVLPYTDNGMVFENFDNRLWKAWEKWRIRSTTEFFRGIRETYEEVNPRATQMTYSTHAGLTARYAARQTGGDIVDRARFCDFLGTEIMASNVFDCYRPVYAYRKMKAALCNHTGQPVWGLIYHIGEPAFAYFGWALLQMNRQVPWMTSIEDFDMGQFISWQDKMKAKDARSLSNIAILFSRQSVLSNRTSTHRGDILGFSEMLTDAHIQHDFVLDQDINVDVLSKYRLLVLASAECLSVDQVAAISRFVREGGALIVTGWSSQCDEEGFRRGNLQLADVLSVDLVKAHSLRGPCRIRVGKEPAFQVGVGATGIIIGQNAEVLAHTVDRQGALLGPAVVASRYGNGKAIYSAITLGTGNCQQEKRAGGIHDFVINKPARALLWALVRKAVDDSFPVEPVQVPEKVLLAAYRVGERYAIHLLNATGVNMMPGDVYPRTKTGEPFPELKDNIIFDLRVESLSSARVVSPDYEGERQAHIELLEDGAWRITVPGNALKAYSVVYFT